DQMTKVEAYIESIVNGVEKQIALTVREVSFQGGLSQALQNDPAVPPFDRTDSEASELFHFPEPSDGKGDGSWASKYFRSYDSFREELARPPKSPEERLAERRIRKTASLTDPQFQIVIRRLGKLKSTALFSPAAVVARSGMPVLVGASMKRYGIVPVLGEDESSVKLDLFLPEHGKALFAAGETTLRPTVRTSVKDGGTVVIAERNANGENRLVFVTAQLLDPAGMPVQTEPAEPVELPAKFEPAAPEKQQTCWILPAKPEAGEAQTPESSGDGWRHVVGQGETLERIAQDFGITPDALREVNRLGDDVPVKPGQLLLVPARPPVESRTEALLKSFIVPGIDFKEASLADSLATLQMLILERHDSGLFPEATPIFVVDAPEKTLEAKITLRLTNVPAIEVIRYISSLAECHFRIEGREVRLLSLKR
ncbi:MAG TPA: LysM domain-containing protein, partial [Bacteroidia bacterium]|nr:LysM domain-containing protein [Bacteroidia bacterium]